MSEDPSIEASRSLAIGFAQAIVDGSMSPIEGANRIWWDVWNHCIQDPASPLARGLTPFVGEASQWDDSEGKWRTDIEASIRRLAEEFLASPEGQPGSGD